MLKKNMSLECIKKKKKNKKKKKEEKNGLFNTLIAAWTELLRFTMYRRGNFINIITKLLACL